MSRKIRTIAGERSISLFRRLKKKNIVHNVVLCCLVVVIFHIKIGDYVVERCRIFINSAKTTVDKRCHDMERKFLNFWYFVSHDVDGILIGLHNENIKLHEEIENLKNLRFENEELRKALLLKKSTDLSVIIAEVTTVFSNDFTRSCILDVGEKNGVFIDDVVRNLDGLIGRIVEVNDTWSRVLFITDMNSSIPVKIDGANAIMNGNNSNLPQISIVHEDIAIKNGDMVKTSGYGIYENIPVGRIVENDKKFSVDLFVNFNSLKYVTVLRTKASKL